MLFHVDYSPLKRSGEYVRVKTDSQHYTGSTSEGFITGGVFFLDNNRTLEVLVLVRVL